MSPHRYVLSAGTVETVKTLHLTDPSDETKGICGAPLDPVRTFRLDTPTCMDCYREREAAYGRKDR